MRPHASTPNTANRFIHQTGVCKGVPPVDVARDDARGLERGEHIPNVIEFKGWRTFVSIMFTNVFSEACTEEQRKSSFVLGR